MTDQSRLGVKYAFDEDSHRVIGAAIEVHKRLGPGFRQEVYERALHIELRKRSVRFTQQFAVNVFYDGLKVGDHVLDLIAEERIVVELKAVAPLAEVHRDQLLGYLRAANLELGLLLNFGESPIGIKRIVNAYRG